MYVKIRGRRHQHQHQHDARVPAHTGPWRHPRAPACRVVADTISHGLSAGRHSTQTKTTVSRPCLCVSWRPTKSQKGGGVVENQNMTR